jgi:hypothetical protein
MPLDDLFLTRDNSNLFGARLSNVICHDETARCYICSPNTVKIMAQVRFDDPVIDIWGLLGETSELSPRYPSRRHPGANMSR